MKRTLLVLGMVLALAMTAMASTAMESSGAEIISPTAGEVVYENTLYLEAKSGDDESVNVAVRTTTPGDDNCSLRGETVIYRDVSGKLRTDDAGIYSESIDISTAEAGLYCFAFDPADAPRISVKFYIVDHYVKAGGVVDATAFDLDFEKRGNGTHAFEGWAADAGSSAGILGEFTLNYRAGEECTYTPGELSITTSVTNPADDLVRVVLKDWDSTAGCERNDIRLLESNANEFFPRGGIYTPGELDTGISSPPNPAVDFWVPLTHGNVHIYSR